MKQRSVPTLVEKLAVLDLLRDGMSVSNVVRKYGLNESSIRAIKVREKEIRQAMAPSAPITDKGRNQKEAVNIIFKVQVLINSAGFIARSPLKYV
ncbi:hypothetical protein Y1Q_0001001 [Alligator mississippiensis]|uniref:HTH psq-type domain-containing protein n=1 Tax=Alligator mississippiensis TaxID=8496 RepID=A0A151NEA3_ALLMI|nr:hypothetical protein Y1Q_0001001 [Alligator mississippiensis]